MRIGVFKSFLWCLATVILSNAIQTQAAIKNLILVIGDGMGPQQIGLLETYAQKAPGSVYKGKPTAFSKLSEVGYVGMSTHWPVDAMVVDSACSATQLALGMEAPSESIGVDANGNTQMSILERAKQAGKATGLVSDTRLTHATPAAFAAHQSHRSFENDIALDMLNAAPDIMLSGGLSYWIPVSVNLQSKVKADVAKLVNEPNIRIRSKRKDNRDLLLEAKAKGYELAFNKTQLTAAKSKKILGLFAYSGMLGGTDYTHQAPTQEPSLPEMTIRAIRALEKHQQGFF